MQTRAPHIHSKAMMLALALVLAIAAVGVIGAPHSQPGAPAAGSGSPVLGTTPMLAAAGAPSAAGLHPHSAPAAASTSERALARVAQLPALASARALPAPSRVTPPLRI